ncbi:hypothetical protein [Chryseobacterium vrystaatense]|uniref:Uncharacterized protein n=1 Tax=Chryseobacterium vrystaatense TaxID=307480 RepID=A0A1M5IJA0_9FLAO|nr:hypothetical protein [Chryseobacterium vrystaatense]SHG28129.1 hypothetical protein SAMN02787073_3884 [Chryseobacterium vrystaatense]
MADAIQILKDFVEGTVSDQEFQQQLYANPDLEKLLSDPSMNWQGTYLKDTTVFLYLAEQDYTNAEGRLNAQGTAKLFLSKMGIDATVSTRIADEYDAVLDTRPKYVDAEADFIEKHILPKDKTLSKSDQKKYIKQRYSQLFKYQTKPPGWIQNPVWPIKNDQPLYFLGQIEIKKGDLFHDGGWVYLFIDNETGTVETVRQLY